MKKFLLTASAILSLFPFAASAAPIRVQDYEAQTHLSSMWENPENRALIEARIQMMQSYYQAGALVLDQQAFSANKVEVQKYSNQVRCLNGEQSVCKPAGSL